MRKVLILVSIILIAGGAMFSQEAYLELLRSDLRTQKVALVTEAMELTDAQSEVFWPIFRKYDAELATLNDQRIALIKDYAQNFDKMTDAKADELTKKVFSLLEKRLKLQEDYYLQFTEALGSIVAARFMQAERQINALVDLQIASELPLIKK
jgi:hypothetical protein